jgi:hypothetical protein
VVERKPDGLTITVPPPGVVRGGGVLFWFALLWNLAMVPFVIGFGAAALAGEAKFNDRPAGPWAVLFLVPFVAVGVAFILIVIHLGRRRCAFAVVGDRLFVFSAGLRGGRRGEWSRSELTAIDTGPSTYTINNRPVLELHIRPRAGPPWVLLGGRDAAELRWIAVALRQALRLENPPPGETASPPAARAAPGGATTAAPLLGDWGPVVGGVIGGGILATFLWLFLAQAWFGGFNVVQRLGWPFSSGWYFIPGGAAVGGAIGLVSFVRRNRHRRQLAALCAELDFTFQPRFTRGDLGDFQNLSVFLNWSAARNLMTGRWEGIPVRVLDYTSVQRSSDSNTYQEQTLVLLSAPPGRLLPFDLRPRDLATKLLALLSPGITFAPAADTPEADPDNIERFGRIYYLRAEPLEKLQAAAAFDVASADPLTETAIRQQFTADLLAFFAEHPGWCVQSDGEHVALWRARRVVRAADRGRFLTQALAIYRALTEPRRPTATIIPAGDSSENTVLPAARVVGGILGLFGGFLAGAGAGIAVAQALDQRDGLTLFLVPLAFLGCAAVGAAVGAVVGYRLLGRRLVRFLGGRSRQREKEGDN